MDNLKGGASPRWRRRALALLAIGAVITSTVEFIGVAGVSAANVSRQDTLVVGQFRIPTGYIGNVYVTASDAFVSDGIHQLVYEPLFYLNPQSGKDEPWLGTSFSYSKDYTQLTIDL